MTHSGCGIHNPFAWMNWAGLIAGAVLANTIILAAHTLWGLLGWLIWGFSLVPLVWWEFVHSPAKMYRTWEP